MFSQNEQHVFSLTGTADQGSKERRAVNGSVAGDNGAASANQKGVDRFDSPVVFFGIWL